MPKLDADFIKTVAVPAKDRVTHWDDALKGFGLMITASGHRSYVVKYRAGTEQRRMTLKPGLKIGEARKEAKAIIGRVAKGGDPLTERRAVKAGDETTFKAVVELYFKRDGKNLRTADERKHDIERLVMPKFGKRQIAEISRADIIDLLDDIEDENGPVMADLILAYIRRVMNWYAGRSRTDFRSPITRGMARTKPSKRRRQRILSDIELRALWKATKNHPCAFSSMVRAILLTAVRRTEASAAASDEFAQDNWVIPSERYKTGVNLVVPLSTAARAVLAHAPRIGNRWVFTTDGKRALAGYGKPMNALRERMLNILREADPDCEMKNWTLHDLRRTARTLMSRQGVDQDVAEKCLGHLPDSLRATYDCWAYVEEKRAAFEALGQLVLRIVMAPAKNIVELRTAAQ
jgi:integrase